MTDYTLVTKNSEFNELMPVTKLDVLSDAIRCLTKMYNKRLANLNKALQNESTKG